MFTQKLSMKCTEEQYNKYLKNELIKMGYNVTCIFRWHDPNYSYIANNFNFENGQISNINVAYITNKDRTYLGEFNADLFLALAAMTDSVEGNYGEYWVALKNITNTFTKGKIYKQISSLNDNGAFIDNEGGTWGNYPSNLTSFRKATKEEIINKFQSEKELIPEKGEYYYCKCKDSGNEYVFISKDSKSDLIAYYSYNERRTYKTPIKITDDSNIGRLRLATSEERQILDLELAKQNKYFDKETMSIKEIKKEDMKTFKTTRSNMQKIYDMASPIWKPIIVDLVNKYATSPFSEEVILPEIEVEKIFKGAISSQRETLNDVFPDYKEGDKNIFIKNPNSEQISNLEAAFNALVPNHTLKVIDNAGLLINRPDLNHRALFVGTNVKVIVHANSIFSIIEFIEK